MQKTVRNCNIFVVQDKNLKIDIENVNFLTPPILFKEFMNQLHKINKKNGNLNNVVVLKNLQFNSKNYEVIFDRTNKKVRLTELEGRLLKFLSEI